MTENLQDEILAFEDCTEYNISCPVIITRWEIKQVLGLSKQYLQVYFQKLDNTVKAFQLNVACYSAFGKEIEKLSDISIQEVDKKGIEFSEVIPLNSDIQRVEFFMCQCLLIDGSIIEKHDKQMVVNTFKPFTEEDRAVAQRLLPSAAGYPMDNVTHWYCVCGKLNVKGRKDCISCGAIKSDIFQHITEENIQKVKAQVQVEAAEQSKKKRKRNKLLAIISGAVAVVCILIGALVGTLAPLSTVSLNGMTFEKEGNGYVLTDYKDNGKRASVEIPSTVRGIEVTKIGNIAFYYSNIARVTIPCSVTSIGVGAFGKCTSLTNIIMPDSIVSIGNNAFKDCTALAEIIIPESVVSIGFNVFNGCKNLKNITIPYVGNEINKGVFGSIFGEKQNSDANQDVPLSLQEVTITGCADIPAASFANCYWLTSVTIPDTISSLGSSAFSRCSRLTSISIPNSVISIGDKAFFDCSELKSLKVGKNVASIGTNAFHGCGSLTSIQVDANNSTYKSSNNCLLSKDGKNLILGSNNSLIPDTVTSIENYAFYKCSELTSITIPNSVTSIGGNAFQGCSKLTNIKIPNSVISIGMSVFYDCSGLTSVTIPSSVTSIGTWAFCGCSELTSITIPNSVTVIEWRAFEGCNKLKIYCEAKNKPSGWDTKWNYDNRPVVWGYEG